MAALTTPEVKEGWEAPEFRLQGTDGKYYTLADLRGKNGLLIMFICNHCPFVKAVLDKIIRDTKELKTHGINSVAIMSNDEESYPEDSFENMKILAKTRKFSFPYLLDDSQGVAKAYDAVCTPDFFGFDKDLKLRYRGRLDSSGMKDVPNAPRELFDAMVEVAKTAKAPKKQEPSIGCSIKWRRNAA